jgi:hypothetical protein
MEVGGQTLQHQFGSASGIGIHLTGGFRGQLDRASLSVSGNMAEGFERATTDELLSLIAIARLPFAIGNLP